MIFKVISIKILLFMTILLFFTWTIVLCATSSRRLKADDTNKIAINKIREEAKACTTFQCIGSKCYELRKYVNVHYVKNHENFATIYETDLKNRGWYNGQNGTDDIITNNFRAMTLINNDIVIYDKYSTQEGKINFDELHELCHVLAGDGGITPNYKLKEGIQFYEGLVNLIAKKFAIKNENLIDTYTLPFTYEKLTSNLEELFEFLNQKI